MKDSFYIGYLPKAPRDLAKVMAVISAFLLTTTIAVSFLLVKSQDAFYPSRFEFGNTRTYEGWYQSHPVPSLIVVGPGLSGLAVNYLLVAEGKHGAEEQLTGLKEGPVRLEGTLIQRDQMRMLEVVSGSVEEGSDAARFHGVESVPLGSVTLRGEIVDSKCFLGVMNPGDKTVHRACATLCIRGDIPPMLVLKNPDQTFEYLLLRGAHGERINQAVLPYVARPVVVEGDLYRHGSWLEVRADPKTIKILR
ncbi:MAG: hypothetical protein BMS9Abin05_0701 [Rhodothermia bacterium]|nr:MAG: hypothetical protein BMS9Abin05_0701 [Rhodothermia bacterium]